MENKYNSSFSESSFICDSIRVLSCDDIKLGHSVLDIKEKICHIEGSIDEVEYQDVTYALLAIYRGFGILCHQDKEKAFLYKSLIKDEDGNSFACLDIDRIDIPNKDGCIENLYHLFYFLFGYKDNPGYLRGSDDYSLDTYRLLVATRIRLNSTAYFLENENKESSSNHGKTIIDDPELFHYVFLNEGEDERDYLWNRLAVECFFDASLTDKSKRKLENVSPKFSKEELAFIEEVAKAQSRFFDKRKAPKASYGNLSIFLSRYISKVALDGNTYTLDPLPLPMEKLSSFEEALPYYLIYDDKHNYIGDLVLYVEEDGSCEHAYFLFPEGYLESDIEHIKHAILKLIKKAPFYFEKLSRRLASDPNLTKIVFSERLTLGIQFED